MRLLAASIWLLYSHVNQVNSFQSWGGCSSSSSSISNAIQVPSQVWGTKMTSKPLSSPTTLLMSSSSSSSTDTVQVKRLPEISAVEIMIPVPGSATKAAYDKVCMELSKQLTLPGFRKGSKIPPQVLEQTMAAKGGRNALKVQAINELVNQLVGPTLKAQELDPIGVPVLQTTAETLAETFVPGAELQLNVKCDVWPDIQWLSQSTSEEGSKPYVGLTGSYQRKPFNQEKLDIALRDLKERYATVQIIDDNDDYVLGMGDACTVNMVGYLATPENTKGESLPNAASGDNVEVILGPGRYMEGLVEGLVGAKKGDTVTVTVTFPEKLRDRTLAGKKAIFDVDVVHCSKRSVPELTDEFANQVKAGLTAEDVLAELRKAIDEEDSKAFGPARNAAIGKALAQCVNIVVPDTLVTNQAREKFAVMMAEMRDNGVSDEIIKEQINPENFGKYKDIVKGDIIRDFKVSMATDEIARLEGITVPDYQIEEQMEVIRKDTDKSEEVDENMIRMKVETTLQRQLVMEWLATQAKLDVTYENAEPEFDETLLEQLAQESIEREQALASGSNEVSSVATEIDEIVVVTEEAVPVVEAIEAVVEVEVSEPVPVAVVPEPEPVAVVPEPEPVAVVPEPEPVAVVPEPEPVAAVVEEVDYSKMTLAEKAFVALFNAGVVKINKGPGDPDYDPSEDDLEAPENVYVQK